MRVQQSKKSRRRKSIHGGLEPLHYDYWKAARDVYNSQDTVHDGFELIAKSGTAEAWKRDYDKDILVAFRGTKGSEDYASDLNIISGLNFRANARYMRDKEFFKAVRLLYPPLDGWSYYVTGHSLGGAIATAIVEDFPDVVHAREYNPAIFHDDVRNDALIDRIYNSRDPIYLYHKGRNFATKVVTNNPKLVNYFTPYAAHSLEELEEFEKVQ